MHPTVAESGLHDRGPGLFAHAVTRPDGTESEPFITNIRRLAGTSRKPGSVLIGIATTLLFLLGLGLFAVSLRAQYSYVFSVKHASAASVIEAIALDAGMAIFSLLALGLSRSGKSARIERVLILACAAGSAVMNYAAADVASPRSILAYVMPPIFLAVVVDRVIAVVRRHVLGESEGSPWTTVGRAGLYVVRFVLAPASTAKGVRRALLNATPVPESPKAVTVAARPALTQTASSPTTKSSSTSTSSPRSTPSPTRRKSSGQGRSGSKTSHFLELVGQEHGSMSDVALSDVYVISQTLAPKVDLDQGSARTALRRAVLAAQAGGSR